MFQPGGTTVFLVVFFFDSFQTRLKAWFVFFWGGVGWLLTNKNPAWPRLAPLFHPAEEDLLDAQDIYGFYNGALDSLPDFSQVRLLKILRATGAAESLGGVAKGCGFLGWRWKWLISLFFLKLKHFVF